MNEQNPKVFISYSHDSDEHKKCCKIKLYMINCLWFFRNLFD